jgi:hypothetical protein
MILGTLMLLGLLALFLIAGGIPVGGAVPTVVFHTPLFMMLLALLCVMLGLGCARYGRGWRRLVFWPVHLGVVLILVGAGLGALRGVEGQMTLPVGGWHAASHLPLPDGRNIPLGFAVAVDDFEVTYYEPTQQTPKLFKAELTLKHGETTTQAELMVNHPVTANGWRIYLMSYELGARPAILVSVRHDPGRRAVITGIWFVIIGTALLCWRKRKAPAVQGASDA